MRHPIDSDHWLYRKSPEDWLADARVELRRGVDLVDRRDADKCLPRLRAAVHCAFNAMLASRETLDERKGASALARLRRIAASDEFDAATRARALWLIEARRFGEGEYVLRSAGEWHLLREAAIALVEFAAERCEP
ncbi:MAG: hypothetical protein JNK05_26955 [Myxococcales bacterium]|nr:hypothetical protein [Myxococcales bacterium]